MDTNLNFILNNKYLNKTFNYNTILSVLLFLFFIGLILIFVYNFKKSDKEK